ncbi:Fanconi anemia core complex-associated protein 20 [Scleropages formosus]|uniref:Fanconi anemia core complex-associated protein 20 n=1 Tax=Scleropages formosus TaxID=113540 RepID=UPI0008789991|nr:Fanconi anemia core complex-associated protein 20 [Scleropages formosus]
MEHEQRRDLFPRPGGLALRLGNEQPQEPTSSWETTGGSVSADRPRPQVEPAGASLAATGNERIADQDSAVGADGSSRGGDSLESCPMCLMRFPAGFSQMDCDSHLAKCLSEMNEDITW